MKEMEQIRLDQARQSLEEAKALLAEGMDAGFVLTHIYYAFYYSILALMTEGRVPTTMQSVTLGLFEQQFIRTGLFKQEYANALSRLFAVKPKCSGLKTPVSADEVKSLFALAGEFIPDVERYVRTLTHR